MAMRLVLVTGGARAGKSRYAQARARALGGDGVTYIATALVGDDEMRERVARHRADRPPGWRTIEAPRRVGSAIRDAATSVVLLDCLTMLSANALERARPASPAAALDAVAAEIDDLLRALPTRDGALLAVTNEVGLSVHPPTAIGRWFQDALGMVNQRVAALAEEVVLLVAGVPVVVKSTALHGRASQA
jgi:adenosyl cobinamide kinase/adenosyl cobinamide phosphate guanylyltransferase